MIALLGVGYFVTGDPSTSVDWVWKEPRDLLVDRVEAARDSQHAAADQFQDALAEFKAVVGLQENDLERQYKKLNAAHKRSQAAAEDINKRVDRVVSASNRLLDEWRDELDDYNDPNLRGIAEVQFDQTPGTRCSPDCIDAPDRRAHAAGIGLIPGPGPLSQT